jgi:lipoyl synthase
MIDRLPSWLKQKPIDPEDFFSMEQLTGELNLHTICESALCPNKSICYGSKTASFLILGKICTRHCAFCSVAKGKPEPPDIREPHNLKKAIAKLGLKYAVITSVTRDDLPDGGSAHFAASVNSIHESGCIVETLVPDFRGSTESIKTLAGSSPEVISHNLETVPRLYAAVRSSAVYETSLNLLRTIKINFPKIVTKSGLMLGLGENFEEVLSTMKDLRNAGCQLITIGQYLRPEANNIPASRYVTPAEFYELEKVGKTLGFTGVASGPLVRSSFKAAELYLSAKINYNMIK